MIELPEAVVHYSKCSWAYTKEQMLSYGKQCTEEARVYSRKQALEESLNICNEVRDQVVENAGAPYQAGRNMGAVVCGSKIKELLK